MFKKLALAISLLLSTSLAFAEDSARQIPLLLNYQGTLTDEGGNLLPDGATSIRFQIIDSSGTILYDEEQELDVVEGEVSAIIGNGVNPSNGAPAGGVPLDIFSPTDIRYLQVIADGYKPYGPMEIVSAPYALWADTALKLPEGAITGAMIGKGVITKEHLDAELISAVFPQGIPKTLLPSDTVYTGDFEGFQLVIQSTEGAGKVGVVSTFVYSGSQTVQGVLKDLDLAVKKRQEEVNWAKKDYNTKITATSDSLQAGLTAEAEAREAADTAETAARAAADTAETAQRQAADAAEAAERAAADTAEVAQRQAADAAEAATRQAADNAEKAEREAADTAHFSATSAHGVSGDIVGTDSVQTLTNKTLTSPAVSGGTIDDAVIGGTTPAAGTFTSVTATSMTLNGNDLSSMLVPVGTIIPFYDYNGVLTFNTSYWAYCDGSTKTIAGMGSQTLPDLSNRYLVGFGTDGGGDIDTAAWDTAAVGNTSHQVALVDHSHAVDPPSTTSGTESATHKHTPGLLQFAIGQVTDAGGGTVQFNFYDVAGLVEVYFKNLSTETLTGSGYRTYMYSATAGDIIYTQNGSGVTGTESATHTHNVDIGSFSSGSTVSATQNIQPRSIRVRYIMRVK